MILRIPIEKPSYYDWDKQFKGKKSLGREDNKKPEEINSLGFNRTEFREYLKNWKEKNLNGKKE